MICEHSDSLAFVAEMETLSDEGGGHELVWIVNTVLSWNFLFQKFKVFLCSSFTIYLR